VVVGRADPPKVKETLMGVGKKISNAAEEAAGKAKETIGRVTGNKSLEAEGVADQGAAKAKKAVEKVKDVVEDTVKKVKKTID